MTSGSQINYETLAQDAMRGLVRTVLKRVEADGLPGEHHFYIAFDTRADGVDLSKRIKEQYPEEMTIVLQHRFWDLAVRDEDFEVKLTFDGIPERLCVPFSAVKVFFDPSVPYGLQFEAPGSAEETVVAPAATPAVPMPVPDSDSEDSTGPGRRAPASVPSTGAARKRPKADAAEKTSGKDSADDAAADDDRPLALTDAADGPDPAAGSEGPPDAPEGEPETDANEAAGDDEAAPTSAEVVQLDAFRKKT